MSANVDWSLAERRDQAIRERLLRAMLEWKTDRSNIVKAMELTAALEAFRPLAKRQES